MAPWLWPCQTAGLELLKHVLAHTTDMGGLLDGNTPVSLGVQKRLFIFPVPCSELSIEDDIEFLIEIVTPEACAVIGGLEIDIPALDALVVVPKQAHDHLPLPWRCEIQRTAAKPLRVHQYPLLWQQVGHGTAVHGPRMLIDGARHHVQRDDIGRIGDDGHRPHRPDLVVPVLTKSNLCSSVPVHHVPRFVWLNLPKFQGSVHTPNAGCQAQPMAGARHERRLLAAPAHRS